MRVSSISIGVPSYMERMRLPARERDLGASIFSAVAFNLGGDWGGDAGGLAAITSNGRLAMYLSMLSWTKLGWRDSFREARRIHSGHVHGARP